jgi:Leucine-rich repeat (LRR) protein
MVDFGFEVIGIPRPTSKTNKNDVAKTTTTSLDDSNVSTGTNSSDFRTANSQQHRLLQRRPSYELPHTVTHDEDIEVTLQHLPRRNSKKKPLPRKQPNNNKQKKKHKAGDILRPAPAAASPPQRLQATVEQPAKKRQNAHQVVAGQDKPVIHIEGDPFAPCFRVVGVDPKSKSSKQQQQQQPQRTRTTAARATSPTRGLSYTSSRSLLDQTISTTPTDEQDDVDDEAQFSKTRDRFLQLDIENPATTLDETILHGVDGDGDALNERFEDEESAGKETTTVKDRRTRPKDYLKMTQRLMQQQKEKQRQAQQLQRSQGLPSSKLPWKRPTRGWCLPSDSPGHNNEGENVVKKPDRLRRTILVLMILATAGIILTLVVLLRRTRRPTSVAALQGSTSTTDGSGATGSSSGTWATSTTSSSTTVPIDPQGQQANQDAASPLFSWMDFPDSTKALIASKDPVIPQVQAYQWLLQDPNLASYPPWRQKQRFALATLYYSTNGPYWRHPSKSLFWMDEEMTEDSNSRQPPSSTLEECQWFPQACDDTGRLRRLLLNDINLDGTIPPEIFWGLSALHQIQFQDNPNLRGPIPTEIGLAQELQVVWLQRCGLGSSNNKKAVIPTEIGLLGDSLLYLDLSYNPLGSLNRTQTSSSPATSTLRSKQIHDLPTELGLLTSLQELILASDYLIGTLPSEIGRLKQLQYSLQLQSNSLSGVLPTTLGHLQALEHFYASSNHFAGSVPSQFGLLSNLKILDLSENHLEGQLPVLLFGNAGMEGSKLEQLWIYDNLLTGSLASSIGYLSNTLTSLDLSMNQLASSLPTEIGRLKLLAGLWMYQNGLTGPLPSELGEQSQLHQLSLFGNKLSGSIPSQLSALDLQALWLDDNSLSGRIPSDLLASTTLVALHLFTNRLRGPIADVFSSGSLQELRLENNFFTGTIPSSLGRQISLEWLQLQNNELSGTIPTELASLTKLIQLSLQGNQLWGGVPSEVCAVKASSMDFLSIGVDCSEVDCDCNCLCPFD